MAHHPAAFINALSEEGTKAEAIDFLQKEWDENCGLRKAIKAALDSLEDQDEIAVHAILKNALAGKS